jgi:hypothetical protein
MTAPGAKRTLKLDRLARRWTSLTFDVRFLRERCPKLDVGGEAIGEFLRSGPLRFALAMESGGQRAHQVRYVQPRAVPRVGSINKVKINRSTSWRVRRTNPKDWLPSNPRPHLVEGIGSRGRQRTGDRTRYLRRLEPDLATRIMN